MREKVIWIMVSVCLLSCINRKENTETHGNLSAISIENNVYENNSAETNKIDTPKTIDSVDFSQNNDFDRSRHKLIALYEFNEHAEGFANTQEILYFKSVARFGGDFSEGGDFLYGFKDIYDGIYYDEEGAHVGPKSSMRFHAKEKISLPHPRIGAVGDIVVLYYQVDPASTLERLSPFPYDVSKITCLVHFERTSPEYFDIDMLRAENPLGEGVKYFNYVNLRLRDEPNTNSQTITVLEAFHNKLMILEMGEEETIDGITSNWVYVIVEGKETYGWCFGGYLTLSLL